MAGEFQYQPYQNPYVSTIVDLMGKPAQAQAAAIQQAAAARAQAQQQSGQAWGQAAQAMGQDASKAITTANDPQRQAAQLQLQTYKQTQAAMKSTAQAMSSIITTNPDGSKTLDPDKLPAMLQQLGVNNVPPQMMSEALKSIDDVNGTIQKFTQSKIDHRADLANSLLQSELGKTPSGIAMGTAIGVANGLASASDAQFINDAVAQAAASSGANGPAMVLHAIRSQSEKYKDAEKPVVLPPTPAGAAPATLVVPGGSTLATGAQSAPKPMDKNAALSALSDPNASPQLKSQATAWMAAESAAASNPNEPITVKTMENGKPVEKVMTRADALRQGSFPSQPPASVQINTAAAAASANAPPVDASRPTGADVNKIDPQTGLTEGAKYQLALDFGLKGTMPPMGFGQSPRAMAVRTAIPNKAAAIAAAAGVDLPTVQAEYKANSATLNKLLPQAQATANASNTATDNLDLALAQSDDVTRGAAKLGNRFVNWAAGNLTPAAGLTKFETYIYTAAREYAKVTSGGAASSQGLTDSAAKEAEKLINAAQSPEAFQAAVEAMKGDMANVVKEQANGLAKVSGTIANFFSAANGGGPVSAPTGTAGTGTPAPTAPAKWSSAPGPNGTWVAISPNGKRYSGSKDDVDRAVAKGNGP